MNNRNLQNHHLPNGWRESNILAEAPLQRGFDLPAHSVVKGDYPVIGSNGVIFHHNKYMCTAPGLVTGRSGTIGNFTFIPEGYYWPHNTSLWITNFHDNDPEYIYYLYGTLGFENYLTGTGVPTLNRNLVHEISIILPPLDEQRRIAKALSDIDSLISSLTKLIEKKQNMKTATMQQLLTGKKRLDDYTEPWEEKEIGTLGRSYSGLTGKSAKDFGHGAAKYVTFLNVLNNPKIDISIFEAVDVSEGESQNAVRKGDLLFNTSSETPNEVGICSAMLNDVDGLYLNSFCFGFRPNESIDSLFMSYWFRSSEGRILMSTLAQGSTRYNLSKENMMKSVILIPKKDEQKSIAQVLDLMDTEISAIVQKRAKYESIKKGMMQELLTGKIRLV